MGKRNYLWLQGLVWDAVTVCVGVYEGEKGRKQSSIPKTRGWEQVCKEDSAEVKGAQVADEFVRFPREFS